MSHSKEESRACWHFHQRARSHSDAETRESVKSGDTERRLRKQGVRVVNSFHLATTRRQLGGWLD